ncbi:unnamed protein product, partial [Mesorhabditis belari]|uniref:Beta-lactamase-related domain-containing protein n=1 Tax=Mesorhabditis belari TaxID=2138241 RepID=A0AAF3FD38_9BILA
MERDLFGVLDQLQNNGYLATSVCPYRYLNDTLYVVNAEAKRGRHFPVHFCTTTGLPIFTSVWHKVDEFLWHYVIEQGSLEEMLKKDTQMGQEGYYIKIFLTFKNTSSETLQAIILWRKGFGVRYRFEIFNSIHDLEPRMGKGNSDLELSVVHLTPNQKVYTIWRDHGTNTSFWVNEEIEKVMRTMEIPSMSIFVQVNGIEIYKAAFGYADVLQRIKANPDHRYRIASISKTITAMAIQELINQKKIRLDSLVFGPTGILGHDFGTRPYNSQMLSITVQHLLEHTVGSWEHFRRYEFSKQNFTNHQFLSWLFDSHPPKVSVNIVHLYSNVGYIILGRVIEKISGVSYEKFVQENLFNKLHIKGHLGTRKRQENEVCYYSHDNANPYFNWDPVRMDAAAGWTLTAQDVAKIFENLSKNRYREYENLIQRSRWDFAYGRGVQIGWDQSFYHFGSLAGIEGIGFTRNGFQCAILVNVRGKQENFLTHWMLQFCQAFSNQ